MARFVQLVHSLGPKNLSSTVIVSDWFLNLTPTTFLEYIDEQVDYFAAEEREPPDGEEVLDEFGMPFVGCQVSSPKLIVSG
jgi:hypothetical protein